MSDDPKPPTAVPAGSLNLEDNDPAKYPTGASAPSPEDDLDTLSEARDDIRTNTKGRDSKGRLVRGHKSFPSAGRPVEIAAKSRRALMKSKAMTVLAEISSGERIANPGQIEAIRLLLDRGYGKVVDVQTHLHLMAGASTEEKSGLSVLSADALTSLARALSLPATTQPIHQNHNVVEGELVDVVPSE